MKTLTLTQRTASLAGIDVVLRTACAHNWTAEQIEAHMDYELGKAKKASWLWKYRYRLRNMYEPLWCRCNDWVPDIIHDLFFDLGNVVSFRGPAEWNLYSVENYLEKFGPLPGEAVVIVCAVNDMHNHKCYVHVLEQDNFLLDPILEVVAPDGTSHYPLVWDGDGSTILPPN